MTLAAATPTPQRPARTWTSSSSSSTRPVGGRHRQPGLGVRHAGHRHRPLGQRLDLGRRRLLRAGRRGRQRNRGHGLHRLREHRRLRAHGDGGCNQPDTAPSEPTNVVVTPTANGQSATVTWSPPASDGGSPVTGYTVTRTGANTPCELGVVGTTHLDRAHPRNGLHVHGRGQERRRHRTRRHPDGRPCRTPRPRRPTWSATPTPDGHSATVTWSPPASDGGSPVTGYTVTRTGNTTVRPRRRRHPHLDRAHPRSGVHVHRRRQERRRHRTRGHPGRPPCERHRPRPTSPGRHPDRERAVRNRDLVRASLERRQPVTGYTVTRTGSTPVDLGVIGTTTWTGLTPGIGVHLHRRRQERRRHRTRRHPERHHAEPGAARRLRRLRR